jgi:Mg2+/Co2+ transporter CorB
VQETELSHSTLILYCIAIVALIVTSAFFSCAETGLMAINRYRLRHAGAMKKRWALLILKLLKRPDRLLGMLLIGNNISNIFSAALATIVAIHFFGEKSVMLVSVFLAFIVLILAEVVPKTIAALYPERVSRILAWPIFFLLKLFYPLVWFINVISNGLLRLMCINVSSQVVEPLNREELRSIVYEGTGKVLPYQRMLLGILDLNKVTVDDVMIPRHKIVGIDLEQSWEHVVECIAKSKHDWLPIYKESINQISGVLHVREVINLALSQTLQKETLLKLLHEPYFVPQGALLNMQLQNFQRQRQRMALVVDEYGEIQGLITLKDILEEIVGEFTLNVSKNKKMIVRQSNDSYLVEGAVSIRELNRVTQYHFPTDGSKTLNGLIVESLETIPRAGVCVRIGDYAVEIKEVKNNRVKMAHLFKV